MDETLCTPKGIETVIAAYVTEGPVTEILGLRCDYCHCPGAHAVAGALARSVIAGKPFQVIFGRDQVKILNGKPGSLPITVDHTPRVTAFIDALDDAGRDGAQVRRKQAKAIWQMTAGKGASDGATGDQDQR